MTAKKRPTHTDPLIGRRVRIADDQPHGGEEGTIVLPGTGGNYYVRTANGHELAYGLSELAVSPAPGQTMAVPGQLVDADPWLVAFSLTNPRRRRGLDIDSLNGLAASIKAQGLAQPILVRPLPGARAQDTFTQREDNRPLPTYELVCGERRLRASRIAGMDTIPMLVRDLSDDAALELQLVENIEREDLDPMEEAEGCQMLRDKLGYTVEQIAERIGRGKGDSYIRKVMKLLDLTPASREAMYDGRLGRSTGLLVARYPAAKQAAVLKYIEQHARNGEPAPFRDVAPKVFTHFNLALGTAVFPITDASLVPAAGACTSCPKRTGAQAQMFDDEADTDDSCTDPDCFAAKRTAHVAAARAQAVADGLRVLDEDETKAAFPSPWRSRPIGYVSITDVAYTTTSADGVEREVTFEDALRGMGKKAPKPIVIINPHTGTACKVITEDLADKLQPNDDDYRPPRVRGIHAHDERTEEEKALDEHNVQRAVILRMFDAIRLRPRTAEELRRAVKTFVLDQEGTELMQEFLGWPNEDQYEGTYNDLRAEQRERIDAMLPDELGQVLAMAVAEISMGAYDSGLQVTEQVELARSYGIDVLAVRDKVAQDLQAGDGEDDELQKEDEEAAA